MELELKELTMEVTVVMSDPEFHRSGLKSSMGKIGYK